MYAILALLALAQGPQVGPPSNWAPWQTGASYSHAQGVELYGAAGDGTGGRMDTSSAGCDGLTACSALVYMQIQTVIASFAVGQWGSGGNSWIIAPSDVATYGTDGFRLWFEHAGGVRYGEWGVAIFPGDHVLLLFLYDGGEAAEADRARLYAQIERGGRVVEAWGQKTLTFGNAFGVGSVPTTLLSSTEPVRWGGATYSTARDIDGVLIDGALWQSTLATPGDVIASNETADLTSLAPYNWYRFGDDAGDSGTTINDLGSAGNDGTLTTGGSGSTPAIVVKPARLACPARSLYGQSLARGVCSGGTCGPQTTTPVTGAYELRNDDLGLCQVDEDAANCMLPSVETPMGGFAEQLVADLSPGTSLIFTNSAVAGAAMSALEDGTANYTEFLADLADAQSFTAAAFATHGCSTINMEAVLMIHEEADDSTSNASYGTELAGLVDDFCGDLPATIGQQASDCPDWIISQASSFDTGGGRGGPLVAPLSLGVCTSRSDVYCLGPKYEHAYETNSPYLHLQATGSRLLGLKAGRKASQIANGNGHDGLYPTGVVATSAPSIQLTFANASGDMTRDTTTCTAHTNGDDGWELFSTEIGTPTISSVTASGNVVTLNLSAQPHDFSSFRVRGAWSTANRTCNGCLSCTGAPYTNWRDSSSSLQGGSSGAQWVLHGEWSIDSGALSAPASAATHHFSLADGNEQIAIPDGAATEPGAASTWLWWIRRDNTTHNRFVIEKGGTSNYSFRHWTSGSNYELLTYWGGTGNNRRTSGANLDDSGWHSVVVVYDGSVAGSGWSADPVRIIVDCVEPSYVSAGTPPSSIGDSAQAVDIGNTSNSAQADYAHVAIWDDTVATDAQILEICRSAVDLSTTNLGTPDIWIRPTSSDDPTTSGGIDNAGSGGATYDATGSNMVAGDLVSGGP